MWGTSLEIVIWDPSIEITRWNTLLRICGVWGPPLKNYIVEARSYNVGPTFKNDGM